MAQLFRVNPMIIIYVRSLHNASLYPGLHPSLQCPVFVLQGESFKQFMLQLLTQFLP